MGRRRKENTNIKINKWKTALYLRLSREDETMGRSLSIKNQENILRDYISTQPEFEVFNTYIDDGISGGNDDRPAFQKMLRDIENGNVTCVICKDLSRFSRNYSDAGFYLGEYFPKRDVRFIALGSPFVDSYKNPETVSGMLLPIMNVFNENFLQQTSEKICAVLKNKRLKGEFVGAFAPFGYKKHPQNKNRLIIDEEAAKIVLDIFEKFVYESMSKGGIATKFNELGVPTISQYHYKNGSRLNKVSNAICPYWDRASIHRILNDERYCGHMIQGKKIKKNYKLKEFIIKDPSEWIRVENTHEPIVTQELFNKAYQLQLRDTKITKNEKQLYLFSGFLRCAKCEGTLSRLKGRNGSISYRCRNGIKGYCEPFHIKETVLIERVLLAINTQILFLKNCQDIVEKIISSKQFNYDSLFLTNNLKSLEKDREQLCKKNIRLYDNFADGLIDKELYLERSSLLKEEIKKNKEAILKTRAEIKNSKITKNASSVVVENFKKYEAFTELTRTMLIELIDNIFAENIGVSKDGRTQIKKVTVKFKFQDETKNYIQDKEETLNLLPAFIDRSLKGV